MPSMAKLAVACLALAAATVVADMTAERADLLALRDTLVSAADLHSNWTGPPCLLDRSRWIGVQCMNGSVVGVRLDGVQLTGTLGSDAFRSLRNLVVLSLSDNAIRGALPRLETLGNLRVVDLSRNRFTGEIPAAYATSLASLARLQLQENLLDGAIPAFDQAGLETFNVSYNFLQGAVPSTSTLRRFPASAFAHNPDLCGDVVSVSCNNITAPAPATTNSGAHHSPPPRMAAGNISAHRQPPPWSIIIVVLVAAVCSFTTVFFLLRRYCSKPPEMEQFKQQSEASVVEKKASWEAEKFVGMEMYDSKKAMFDYDELLRSPADVLGDGSLGITYRVSLEFGPLVVVKRLRDVNRDITAKEFTQHFELLGKLRHENLASVFSCHYSGSEKLVVAEHVGGFSLAELLHGGDGVPLNWAARLAVVKGIARGLSYLHQCFPFHKVPHGNLKSSNVVVLRDHRRRHYYHAKLVDYGYYPVVRNGSKLAAGTCPEIDSASGATTKSDVYCFGLVVLEILTGKTVTGSDTPRRVRGALAREWSTDILDVELSSEKTMHEDMLALVEIALACTAAEPERRPRMADVVRMVGEVKSPTVESGSVDFLFPSNGPGR